ncbi:hypothetical protein EF405_20215 [Cyclobacteriaceae bacterium YHN15]|nr:hypothetical protein EF405_20215 [Cyclobacteriaceae bacterium YHN15]
MIPIEDIQKKYGGEMAAVVLAFRVHFKTDSIQKLQEFVALNPPDWQKVMDLCYLHRIRMLVYRILLQLELDESIHDQMKQESYGMVQESFTLVHEFKQVVEVLSEAGITVIPYKGAVFTQQFFGDLISRESSDIDLIIEPSHIKQAVQILKERGYQVPEVKNQENFGKDFFEKFKEMDMRKPRPGTYPFLVEMHWSITETVLDMDPSINSDIHRIGGVEKIAGTEFSVLEKNQHFLYVIVHHAIKDGFLSLREVVDIAQGFKNSAIDRTYLKDNLSKWGVSRAFSVANALSFELFGIRAEEVDKTKKMVLERNFLDQILSFQETDPQYWNSLKFRWDNLKRFLVRVRLRDSLKKQISYLQKVLKNAVSF